jgi:hypothetical protein
MVRARRMLRRVAQQRPYLVVGELQCAAALFSLAQRLHNRTIPVLKADVDRGHQLARLGQTHGRTPEQRAPAHAVPRCKIISEFGTPISHRNLECEATTRAMAFVARDLGTLAQFASPSVDPRASGCSEHRY